jgi:hypothetical protein
MDTKKQISKARAQRLLTKAQKYSGLWDNPDFQDWRNEVIGGQLKKIKQTILTQNLDTIEGQQEAIRNISKYQLLKANTDNMFKLYKLYEIQARKQLKDKE